MKNAESATPVHGQAVSVFESMWMPRLEEENLDFEMGNDFGMDQEIIRRLVERIIKLEVDHETLKRRVDEPLVGNDFLGNDEDGSNNKIILWNRILRLEEGQQVVQKHVQELFANIMDFELQSRGEPCYLHDQSSEVGAKKYAKQKELLRNIRTSFSQSNSPGLKYFTEFGPPALRLFWMLAVIFSVMVCAVSVYVSYYHWKSSSSTYKYTESPVSLGSIPFPAITICPERNIGSKYQLESLLQHCNDWACSRDQFETLSAASFLCPSLMHTVPMKSWSNYYNNSTPHFIRQLIPTCSEDISSYHWSDKGTEIDCSKSFQTLYIDNRVCYSYNMLPAAYLFKDNVSSAPVLMDGTGLTVRPDWSPEFLETPDVTDKTVPHHLDSAGEDFKLTVALDKKPFNQRLCADNFQAFQVAVHHPSELPTRSSLQYLRLPLSHSLYVSVSPRLVSNPDPRDHECLNTREGVSRIFRHYSPSKCQLECRIKCSVSMCGCVPLYLPRVDNTTRWCGLHRRYCPDTLVPELLRGKITWEAIAKHYRKEIRDDLREIITDHLYQYPGQEGLTDHVLGNLRPDCSCHCPPTCASLSYHLDTQVVPLPPSANNSVKANKSEINIYFKEGMEVFTATERRAISNFIDFLAHCGGLVALFTGFSLLTLMEIFYLLISAFVRRPESDHPSRRTSCLRRKQEWDKTAQTDPIFITDGHLNMGF